MRKSTPSPSVSPNLQAKYNTDQCVEINAVPSDAGKYVSVTAMHGYGFSDILLEPLYSNQQINLGDFPKSPVEQVKKRARRQSVAGDGDAAPIFCELLELKYDEKFKAGKWIETARWIKFEETVEEVGERWSKPKIPLITVPSLLQVKNAIKRGLNLLDVTVKDMHDLLEQLLKEWENKHAIDQEEIYPIRKILLSNKEHLVASKKQMQFFMHKSQMQPVKHVQHVFTNEKNGETNEVEEEEHEIQREQIKKYLEHAEAATLLIGKVDFIKKPVAAFIRLKVAKLFTNLSEVPLPNRFIFILLAPITHPVADQLGLIGRTLGAMLTDHVFGQVAYFAEDAFELCYGMDSFLKDLICIPPGKWHVDLALEPNDKINDIERLEIHTPFVPAKISIDVEGLQYTGRLFGGLMEDIKRRMPFYVSDFRDAFTSWRAFSQISAATVFLFFANLTNVIAFGGLMGTLLNQTMGVIECIVASVISGILFGLFSGQPLCIMSSTGPVLMFEALFYEFCIEKGYSFLVGRFYLLMWAAIILLVFVALDASFLVAYITRFTEETFATLISLVFIVESIEAIMEINKRNPLIKDAKAVLNSPCICSLNSSNNGSGFVDSFLINGTFTESDCKLRQGTLSGLQCNFKPDVFTMSILIFLSSFLIAMWLKNVKNSRFLTNKVREIISDFALLLSILITSLIFYLIGLPGVPMLKVPTSFTPTANRSWIINPVQVDTWWLPIACLPPALLLVLLVIMDQQLTTVILNRKENKLRKGFGYHLDMLIVVFLMVISAFLGLPLFLSATILSITHMHALRLESENTAPGENPIFLGVREQRVSPVLSNILMAFSIFMGSAEKFIPQSALLGIFFYMGVSCLLDQQFFHRILLFLTPVKHQPDFSYLRLIKMTRVHFFTLLQIAAFALLCTVHYIDSIEMFFPVMLIALVAIRKILDYIFAPREMCVLDDPLPPWRALMKRSGENTVVVDGVDTAFLRDFGLSSKETYTQ